MPGIDFSGIAARLLAQAEHLVPTWLPGGKRHGREWVCGNLQGDPGGSCSVNLHTGTWADFANDSRGGDLISLYAAIKNISQAEAAHDLMSDEPEPAPSARPQPKPAAPTVHQAVPAPIPVPPLPPPPRSWGESKGEWAYYLPGTDGPVFIVRRFDPPNERKQFLPYTWRNGDWTTKSYPAPRPLYHLRDLLAQPDKPVLIVEGEKACDAAAPYLPEYVITTWAGGSMVPKSANWGELRDRDVTIWPDADEPGGKAAAQLVSVLLGLKCKVRVVVVKDKPEGWDVADAINTDDWSTAQLREFIAENAKLIEPASSPAQGGPKQPKLPELAEPGESRIVRWAELGLATSPNGAPHANLSNAMLVVDLHPAVAGKIHLDTFKGRIMHSLRGPLREWTDADDLSMTAWIQQTVGLHKIGVQTVAQAVTAVANKHGCNSLTDWLSGLQWDGTERLSDWMGDYLGVALTPYTCAVGRNWLISMVARAFKPGCKADHMPVLEGTTGRGKSTALSILGGDWFMETVDAFGGKEFEQGIQGVWLVEIPDLAGFSRREHNKIVGFVSNRVDRYRASYGRRHEDHPRACIFAGTSETDDYFQSSIGLRRFWPIRSGEADALNLDGLAQARDQLFAEAVHLYRSGTTWHETPSIETKEQQEDRRESDTWTDRVMEFCNQFQEVNVANVLVNGLFMEIAHTTLADRRRVSVILKAAGWRELPTTRNGMRVRVWRNPNNLKFSTH